MLKIFAIGIPVTAILCAANLFIGLRGGLTFSAAIPAAVIAAAIFGGAPDKRRLATTTVQSIALPAGTLPEIIFVLPCLVLIGWWQGFPYWETAALCSGGGILGLLVTLPQLSMLADDAALPFPEAVAVAEVIRLGDRGSSKEGRREVARFASAAGAAALFAGLVAINFVANECAFGLRIGRLDSKLGLSFSPALIGAGYLSGAVTGGAILVGLIIAWGIAVPLLTSMHPSDASALAQATAVWSEQVRLIGAGVMAVGAIWTVCRFIGRMFSSYRSAGGVRTVSNNRQSSKAKRDRRSGTSIAALAALVLLAATLAFADERWAPAEVIAMVAAAIAAGALLSGPCGHIAGLIGTSSSPISSIGMLGLMAVVVLTMAFGRSNAVGEQEILALSLFLASGIMAMAALSNAAFEGLKTVRLVDVPLRGQVFALGLGVMVRLP